MPNIRTIQQFWNDLEYFLSPKIGQLGPLNPILVHQKKLIRFGKFQIFKFNFSRYDLTLPRQKIKSINNI